MSQFSGVEVGFSVNGVESTLDPNEYKWEISDSIHKMSPNLNFYIKDSTGMMHEFGTFSLGMDLKLIMGSLGPTFQIVQHETQNNAVAGIVSGDKKIVGKCPFALKQKHLREAHKGKVSDVVKKLFPGNSEIETTAGERVFYLNGSQAETIKNLLTPLALASDDKKTPYLSFIDITETLVFKSINALRNSSPVENLIFRPNSGQEGISPNHLVGFLPFTENLLDFLPKARSIVETLSSEIEFKVTDAIRNKYPVIKVEDVEDFNDWQGNQINPEGDYDNFNKALAYYNGRQSFLEEKVFVVMPFNEKLRSGKVVGVEAYLQDSEREYVLSQYYSGEWLVETCTHIWDGNRASTQAVIARTSVKPIKNSILLNESLKL